MENLTLITGNQNKAAEFGRLLGVAVDYQKVELPEIQETDVAIVAKAKSEAAYMALQRPVFVDDTGLYFNAWNNLPGALIAWFLDNVGNDGLLKMLEGWEDRSATVVTAIGYCDKDGPQVFVGELKGAVAQQAAGDNGFGYDAIFIPEGSTKTFAQMEASEKDAVSMRAIAAQMMKGQLQL